RNQAFPRALVALTDLLDEQTIAFGCHRGCRFTSWLPSPPYSGARGEGTKSSQSRTHRALRKSTKCPRPPLRQSPAQSVAARLCNSPWSFLPVAGSRQLLPERRPRRRGLYSIAERVHRTERGDPPAGSFASVRG